VFGGLLMGVGFIVLFRHQASLGGVNILALYLQDKYGVRAGKVQMAVDVVILLGSYFVVSLPALAASVIGAIAHQRGDLDEPPPRPLCRLVGAVTECSPSH